jgi:hypothetical protein
MALSSRALAGAAIVPAGGTASLVKVSKMLLTFPDGGRMARDHGTIMAPDGALAARDKRETSG